MERAVRQTHVIESDGLSWMAINWFTDERFAFITSSLMLANQEAVFRRAALEATGAREKGRFQSRQQQPEAEAGGQRGRNGNRRGGGGRNDDRDDDRRGDRRSGQHQQDSRSGGGRDSRRGDRTDGLSSDNAMVLSTSGAGSSGASGAAGQGTGASADRRKPMYCKWGPSCTKLADGTCVFKH
jgi:hypothetical protein